jgi:dTDP-4-amino-4,6-dideoxygalactose transaminase
MVEDCAHTVNAVEDGKELGSYGHVAIFSLWKTLRTADGALLVLNEDKEFTPLYRAASSNLRVVKDLALKGMKRAYVAIFDKPIPQRAAQLPPPFLVDVKKMQDDGVQAISTVSKRRILGMDVDRVSSIRRQNFLLWQNSVREFPFINPMFENLQDGDTPFSFPVFAQEGKRDEIRSKLAENGILCGVGFPEAPFEKGFAAARKLAENILELPVHQAFTRQEFDHACKTLRTWNRSS